MTPLTPISLHFGSGQSWSWHRSETLADSRQFRIEDRINCRDLGIILDGRWFSVSSRLHSSLSLRSPVAGTAWAGKPAGYPAEDSLIDTQWLPFHRRICPWRYCSGTPPRCSPTVCCLPAVEATKFYTNPECTAVEAIWVCWYTPVPEAESDRISAVGPGCCWRCTESNGGASSGRESSA